MIGFALSRSFVLSLVLLAASGAADMLSVYFRATLMQVMVPSGMLGRVSAVNQIFIGSSNELGAFESGVAARLLGAVPSVVIGGAITVDGRAGHQLGVPVAGAAGQLRRLRGPDAARTPPTRGRSDHARSAIRTVLMLTNSRRPEHAQLAPVARALDAAEREARVGRDHAVDEHAARPRARAPAARASAAIARPRRRAQAERRGVGERDRLVDVARRGTAPPPARTPPRARPARRAARRRAPSAGRSSPGPSGAGRPSAAARPPPPTARPDRRRRRGSTRSGQRPELGVRAPPDRRPAARAIAAANSRANAVVDRRRRR